MSLTQSLLLDQATWGLTTDINGNIAVASTPYSQAQDVACACRLFLGELYYDTTQGVPYFQGILGQLPPLAYVKRQLQLAALSVPGIASATVFISSFSNRALAGQVIVTLITGQRGVVVIGPDAAGVAAFIVGGSELGGDDVL